MYIDRSVAAQRIVRGHLGRCRVRRLLRAFTAVAIKNSKLYTLTTGANMRRYRKMEDRLRTVMNSFQFIF